MPMIAGRRASTPNAAQPTAVAPIATTEPPATWAASRFEVGSAPAVAPRRAGRGHGRGYVRGLLPRSSTSEPPDASRGFGRRTRARYACDLPISVFERGDRLGHRVEGLRLERVDGVHRLVDVVERGLQRLDADRRGRGLLVDLDALGREQLRRRLDQLRGRRVERGDLVEHELLVGQRLGDDHRGAQGGDGRRGRPVDALDQLDVVLADQVDRQVALDRDGLLGEQVLVLLAHVEQHVVAQRLGLLGVGHLDLRRSSRRAPRRGARAM